jgi:hypothetical protein
MHDRVYLVLLESRPEPRRVVDVPSTVTLAAPSRDDDLA